MLWQIVAKYRLKKGKEDPERVREKFGFASQSAIEKLEKFRKNGVRGEVIWVHAVSVGESLSTIGLIRKMCENGHFVVLTTTTLTSARIVAGRLPERAVHQFCPYPSTKYFKRFTSTWKPSRALFTESEIVKCTVTKGDLLVCEGGDIGRSAIWTYDYDMRIQNHIHRLRRFSTKICTEFYYYLLRLYKQTGRINGIGIGLQGFSSKRVHSLIVPLPPLAEQERIVNQLNELFATMG